MLYSDIQHQQKKLSLLLRMLLILLQLPVNAPLSKAVLHLEGTLTNLLLLRDTVFILLDFNNIIAES